ncbi:hypothetical protein AAA799B03_00954 [Marine Group I thaumarchaeote SCGC AAA799-B03]|uniref:Uncharacterized protein n=1 Tax=Marine Group I thaumarchaeote SCGC AAA799-B03 TaxID=1502289 RepID=A0A087S6X9_9ARCH|nr:hypothetical protein AAA799B03_00954 [Marine Group I thaumarchaeote SCGC AAA799-B03]
MICRRESVFENKLDKVIFDKCKAYDLVDFTSGITI